jgi:protein TonB
VDPVYTQAGREQRVKGTVLLHAIVTDSGHVQILRIVLPIGFGLEEAAADALSQWTFEPATLKGKPVNVSLFIEVNFALRP